jgi:hypothetical protein
MHLRSLTKRGRDLAAVARRVAPWLLAACTSVPATPRIVAVAPNVVSEGVATEVVVDSAGLAPLPAFDIDQGTGVDNTTVTVVLEPGSRALPARRVGADRFTFTVPVGILAGRYHVGVHTPDGRSAQLLDALRVTSAAFGIERVYSDRTYVTPGTPGVPLYVVLRNRGDCPVASVTAVPRFERMGVDRAGTELVARLVDDPVGTVTPQSTTTVEYRVEVLAAATDGEIELDAYATGARHGADADDLCNGSVNAPFADQTARWIVSTHVFDDLDVGDARVSPAEVHRTMRAVNVGVRVHSNASVALTLDAVQADSVPAGVVSALATDLDPRELAPGADATYHIAATIPDAVPDGTDLALAVFVTAHDATGGVHVARATSDALVVRVRP